MKRAAVFIALAAALSPALAEEKSEGWTFGVAPYVFGASMHGSMTIKGHEANIDLSRGDIFDHMDFGAMAMVAARKGKWGVMGDAIWVNLGVDTQVGKLDPALGVVSVAGLRRVASFADVTFGARWTHLDADLDLTVPVPMSLSKSRDWVDPTVGFILKTPEGRRWHASLLADVGGFGVGSDLTWQAMPTVGVDLAKWVSIDAGWRWLDTDYESGSGADAFKYDIMLEGPVLGATFRF